MYIFPYSFWSNGGVSLNNMVAYYKLNNNGNDSHSTNHLSNEGTPSYTAGIQNNALDVTTESNNYLYTNSNSNLSITTDKTFSFWIYPRDIGVYEHCLVKYSEISPDCEYLIHMWPNGNYLEMYMFIDAFGGYLSVATTADIVENQWNLGIFWVDFANSAIYAQVNNKSIISTPFGIYSPYASNAKFIVGARESPIGATPNCIIDEVGIWNRVLSTRERTLLWNNGNGTTYPFTT